MTNPTNSDAPRPDPWEVERLCRQALGNGQGIRQVSPTEQGVRVELSSWPGREQALETLHFAGYDARRDTRSPSRAELLVTAPPADRFLRLNPEFARISRGHTPDRQHDLIQAWEQSQALSGRVATAQQRENHSARTDRHQAITDRAPTERPEGIRQRLLAGYQRRQAARTQRAAHPTPRSARARANLAVEERER
jgi:hypothetical protein